MSTTGYAYAFVRANVNFSNGAIQSADFSVTSASDCIC